MSASDDFELFFEDGEEDADLKQANEVHEAYIGIPQAKALFKTQAKALLKKYDYD